MAKQKQKLALVFGSLPTIEEIDQFQLIKDEFDVKVVSSESICTFLTENSYFQDLTCLALKDYDDNPSYMPGLEKVLQDFDVVVVKERLGIYAYQAVKAKFKKRFRLIIWSDNLAPFAAEDIDQMRTIRREVTDSADAFIVQTKAARDLLLLEGVADSRIISMPTFIEQRVVRDKKSRAKARARLGLAEGDFVITHFGQIEAEEGLVDLAAAVSWAQRTDASFKRRVRVVFCGIGSFSAQLRQIMMNLGIDGQALYIAPTRQATEALLQATDLVYLATVPARDRIDGDPYRVLSPMIHEIPLLAARSPVIEECCGKHRIDFCIGSHVSLGEAMLKAMSAEAIKHDIVKKNAAVINKSLNKAEVAAKMVQILHGGAEDWPVSAANTIDHQVLEAESRVRSKQYLEAIDIIESIFRLPDVPVHHRANLYRLIGDCFAKLGDNDNAKDAYLQTIELDAYNAKGHIGLGTVGLVRASFDIAVLHFQKAVALSPEDEMANLGLGLAFHGMEENAEAARWVVKSLAINPSNTAGIYTLVKIAYDESSFADADRALRAYLEIHPNDYNILYTHGGLLFKQGDYASVCEMMAQIIKTDPLDTRAHTLLKQARRAMDEGRVRTGATPA